MKPLLAAAVLLVSACATTGDSDPGQVAKMMEPFGCVDRLGNERAFTSPPLAALPSTRWKVARATPCDAGARPRALATLEDAPFYARSVVETTIEGESMQAMHESLALDRFQAAWVRALLPFRMPRRTR
jgi:carotenoid 1,2-hydratase